MVSLLPAVQETPIFASLVRTRFAFFLCLYSIYKYVRNNLSILSEHFGSCSCKVEIVSSEPLAFLRYFTKRAMLYFMLMVVDYNSILVSIVYFRFFLHN